MENPHQLHLVEPLILDGTKRADWAALAASYHAMADEALADFDARR